MSTSASTSYTRCRPSFVDIAARRQATQLTKGLSLQSSIDEQQREVKLSAAVYGPVKDLFVCIQRCRYELSRSVRLFLRSQQKGCLTVLLAYNQGWARGSFVEAEARQGSNVLNRGEARPRPRQRARGRGEAERNRCCLCHFDIMHNAHVVVTCSCFVVNAMKNTTD